LVTGAYEDHAFLVKRGAKSRERGRPRPQQRVRERERGPLRCERVRSPGSRSAGRGKRLLARGRADARPSHPAVKNKSQLFNSHDSLRRTRTRATASHQSL
jgi:hypothetical protein